MTVSAVERLRPTPPAFKLITRDTVEEKILRLQEKKRAAIDAAIDSEEPLMTGLTTEELEELLA
jgi:non-specific serine/threonine protein kinase